MRIDAHVHYLPPQVQENLEQFAQQEPYWGLLLNPPHGKSIQGFASGEQMIADMDAAGVDKVVLVGEYFQHHEACVERNRQVYQLFKRWPERILPMAMVQPAAGAKALDELQRCLDLGFCGLGELNPYAQQFRLDDPTFCQLAERCITAGWPLNLHCNEEVGGYYPGKSTTPLRHVYDLALRYPELKLILAHWGGGLFLYELMNNGREALQNVWYDTAASPLLFPTEKIFQVALLCVGAHKILYGSDYPLRIYPRRMKKPGFGEFIQAIQQLQLEPEVEEAIMGGNMARLLNLAPAGVMIQPEMKPVVKPPLSLNLSAAVLATVYPAVRPVLEAHHIVYEEQLAPQWEPLYQLLAVRGVSPAEQNQFLAELQESLSEESEE
jgi:predicted TIM-barrel fold metal-dependent hydrolase